MAEEFPDSRIADLLLGAEQQIRLIDRARPLNLVSERERLLSALSRSERAKPELLYAPPPDLRQTRALLGELAQVLGSTGAIGNLYAARAEELEREARLAEALGTREFRELSRLRFDPDLLSAPAAVQRLLEGWLSAALDRSESERVLSDDAGHPGSLLNILRQRIGGSRQAIRVEIRPGLATVAAAGNLVVWIRPGVPLPPHRAQRIALHELEAHVLPRCAGGRERLALFRTGARSCAEEEEGRGLLLEERAGLLDGERRRELALRHSAAAAVRQGATFTESVRLLLAGGAELAAALEMALRVARGGGLAREIVYLPAYLRVKSGFEDRPELERLFERGRVSLEAARVLAGLSLPLCSVALEG